MSHSQFQKFARFTEMKRAGEKLAVLTAYDFPVAKLLEEAGVDIILVGDSLGMVVLGYEDTTFVKLEDIVHHLRAVRRGAPGTVVVADLPIGTYDTPAMAVESARVLMDAGADAVKLEGGVSHEERIAAIVQTGIPFVGHIGMLPQSVREEGGYKLKGKTPEQAEALRQDALAVERAGASAVVIELVRGEIAAEISASLTIPTIGIGAGAGCDGQVLVIHDLAGLFPWFTPKFAKPEAALGVELREAARRYVARTKSVV